MIPSGLVHDHADADQRGEVGMDRCKYPILPLPLNYEEY
jgi:hypothetical protein